MNPFHVSDLMIGPEKFKVLTKEAKVDEVPGGVGPSVLHLHTLE